MKAIRRMSSLEHSLSFLLSTLCDNVPCTKSDINFLKKDMKTDNNIKAMRQGPLTEPDSRPMVKKLEFKAKDANN